METPKWISLAEAKEKERYYNELEAQLYRDPEYMAFFLKILTRVLDDGNNEKRSS